MDCRMPTPILREGSRFYWLRKRVPDRYREIVGKAEVWRSLGTSNLKRAISFCTAASVELEELWQAKLVAHQSGLPDPETDEPFETLTHKQAEALAGRAYADFYAARSDNPGPVWDRAKAVESHQRRGQRVAPGQHKLYAYWQDITEFLRAENRRLDEDSLRRFAVSYYQARGDAEQRLLEHAKGNYDERLQPMRFAKPERPKIGAVDAFERYADAQKLKPKTKKRWRPVIDLLIAHLGHDDLRKLTKLELITWKNKLLKEKKSDEFVRVPRTVRDVHLAVVRATCQFLVDELELDENPAAGIVVRGVEDGKEDDDNKGFTDEDAATILRATLVPRSKQMSTEMAAAHRWVPWICAYTGARVNEITSLRPQDFITKDGLCCISLRKEVTKTSKARIIPLHLHLLEQGLADYVEVRRRLGKPLFYDPARARRENPGNPQYEKVADKLGDWVRLMHVDHDVWPNHGWRHRWKSQARHVGMHPEIADFITGHGGGSVSKKYGDHWVVTFAQEIAKLPRYEPSASTVGRPTRRPLPRIPATPVTRRLRHE
jgi:integrase